LALSEEDVTTESAELDAAEHAVQDMPASTEAESEDQADSMSKVQKEQQRKERQASRGADAAKAQLQKAMALMAEGTRCVCVDACAAGVQLLTAE
jgi:uncharacterized protein YoxC